MSEKSIYKDLNNIIIDENEFDNINMTDMQKFKLKRSLMKKIRTKKVSISKIIAASVVGLIVFIAVGYANPAFAAQIPILNSIVEMFGKTGDYISYSNVVNKTIAYDGKFFTVDSILSYDNRILIGYTAESNKKINSSDVLFFPKFKINGKEINVGYSGGVKNLTDNKIIGTTEIILNDTLPNNFKFDMMFDKFDGTSGDWNFKFDITKAELDKDAKIYETNKSVAFNDHKFDIDKVTLTPLNTLISISSSSSNEIPPAFFDFWIVLDDNGYELTQVGGSGNQSSHVTAAYSSADKNINSLTLIPFRKDGGVEPSKTVDVNGKLPMELSEGKDSKVVINNIDFSNDKDNVVIKGVIYGKLPNYQVVFLEGDNPKADISLLNTTIKRVDTDKYEFTREYSGLNNDKNYKLIAPNIDSEVDYDSRITVELK
ncbi:DUF4179 domain-containing protein [Clostridium intestinale]|uniref:DUF4179 domain-containing protein n=2 Tax=Clostridium intestinale TaxID=36845 RepID=U2Q1R8_9CLOT|nr:DUF4179 domain-containing protein [Clostridium intestinale]ERK29994.1 hypothetical protein CINTURNW_2705 [Clostridium intestinale URNW]QLY81341.1 DUF4179 domain-containing protein [Clostridium intestinale]